MATIFTTIKQAGYNTYLCILCVNMYLERHVPLLFCAQDL